MIITLARDFVTNNKKNEYNTDQPELIGEEICNKHGIARKRRRMPLLLRVPIGFQVAIIIIIIIIMASQQVSES
jgi:hypothetical protein